ncbi:MAG: multicopper oxidase domain-containing protein [Ilumatobacteraceae bacterium]
MTILTDRPPDHAPSPPPSDGRANGSLLFVTMVGLLIALIASVAAIGLVALLRDDPAAVSGPPVTTIQADLAEFSIDGQFLAPAGQVILDVTNVGTMEHNIALSNPSVQGANLGSGASEVLDLGLLSPGTYQLLCTIPGHAESGMTTDLVVSPAGETHDMDAMGEDGEMDHAAMTGDQMDQVMVESMLAFPAETEGRGNELLEYELMPDGTKQFELTAAVTPWEVSPGKIVDAWTYNGIVPGPMIKVDVGDNVRVILHNETPMGTDIHWHGVHTPNDQDGVAPYTQDVVSSGDSYTYEFVADDPAIGMYHAHMHGQTSVVNGMFASFIIGENPIPRGQTISGVTIPEDLVPDVEMPMILNDAGVIGLTLNGKSFPATEPLIVDEGDWVAVNYYNEGLTAHPMHLHQFPQLVYAKDGIPLDEPYFADTINIAPGERYSVLFHAEDPGTWVWHCHILTHVESEDGMFGMVTALVVNPVE